MKNAMVKNCAAGLMFLSLTGTSALAQNIRPTYTYPVPPTTGPASVQVGSSPFFFQPYVGVAVGRDDNVTLSRNERTSSTLYIVSPGFKLDARSERSVFQLGYQSQIGRYSSAEDDNYNDHGLKSQFDFAFDRRNFVKLGLDYVRGHDPRGSTDRPVSSESDKWRVVAPSLLYAFGAPGAAGRFEGYYNEARKRFLNNRATTALGDRDTREFGGALYIRVAPKTYAVVEARESRIRYVQPSILDARERKYFGGVAWEPTATTSGIVKVGRFQRDFDSNLPDYSAGNWEAAITWNPRTYSRFEVYTSRFSTESSGLGNFIVSDASGVSWSHNWSSVLMTGVDLKFQRDEYQGFTRKDDTMSLGLKVGYKFRRWLTFGAEYTYTKRDSTFESADYDKNLYFLTATASM